MGWAWDYSTIVTYYNVGYLREAALNAEPRFQSYESNPETPGEDRTD